MNAPEALVRTETLDNPLPEEALWRASTWGLLATLLREVPDQARLAQLSALSDPGASGEPGSGLQTAFAMLGLAAGSSSPASVDDEFHDLFIGIGRGELLPYGSWYQTGFLMERPLSELREALARLGYRRDSSVSEPEDHVAALCEVMAMMIQDGLSETQQAGFFRDHLEGWMEDFFVDLQQAESAVFYRSVGRLGQAFLQFERSYLQMK